MESKTIPHKKETKTQKPSRPHCCYVCVHDMDDYVRAFIERLCQQPDGGGVRIVKVYPDTGDDDTVTCEVEAPTKEAFLCWLNEVNVHGHGRWTEVDWPPPGTQVQRYGARRGGP